MKTKTGFTGLKTVLLRCRFSPSGSQSQCNPNQNFKITPINSRTSIKQARSSSKKPLTKARGGCWTSSRFVTHKTWHRLVPMTEADDSGRAQSRIREGKRHPGQGAGHATRRSPGSSPGGSRRGVLSQDGTCEVSRKCVLCARERRYTSDEKQDTKPKK